MLAETVGDLLGEAKVWKVILQDKFRQVKVDRPKVHITKVTGGGQVILRFNHEMTVPTIKVSLQNDGRDLQEE